MNVFSKVKACAVCAFLSALVVTTTAVAQEDLDKKFNLFQRDYLLGDWNGARADIEAHGYVLDLVYTSEYFRNLSGGIKTGGEFRGDLSLTLEVDTSTAGWWDNGEFFLHIQHQHGDGITDTRVGDFQVLSNIDADHFTQISEAWYKHHYFDDRVWLKLGKMESNEDFAFVEFGGEFSASSPGFHPTIPLVTFPDPDWGVVIGLEPVDWFSVNIGAYQGRPDGGRSPFNTLDALVGPMVMIEPAFHYDGNGHPGHFRLGFWYNGDNFDNMATGGVEDGTSGWYASWDQTVYTENPDDEGDEQGLGIFAQYGNSDEEVIEAEQYYGAGAQWIGALPSRDDDILGFGVFTVDFSEDAGFVDDTETAIELYYKVQIAPWITVKPDIQYIVNPGGGGNSDAFVTGFRTEIRL